MPRAKRQWSLFENVANHRQIKGVTITLQNLRGMPIGITVRISKDVLEKLRWKVGDCLAPVHCGKSIGFMPNENGWRLYSGTGQRGSGKAHKGQVRNSVLYIAMPPDVRKLYCPNDYRQIWDYAIEDDVLVLKRKGAK